MKEHIAYVHIKDCLNPTPENNNQEVYVYPGEGDGCVQEIITDLQAIGYDGGISIEPHLAAVFHDADSQNKTDQDPKEIYVRYGKHLMEILREIGYIHEPYRC